MQQLKSSKLLNLALLWGETVKFLAVPWYLRYKRNVIEDVIVTWVMSECEKQNKKVPFVFLVNLGQGRQLTIFGH